MKESKEIKEAKEKWRKITADEKIRDRALRLEIAELDRNTELKYARKEGLEEGMKEGMKEGIKEGEKNIIKKMKEKNLTDEEIMELTGLSLEEINE